jgi:Ca-activated chloride channel family protein
MALKGHNFSRANPCVDLHPALQAAGNRQNLAFSVKKVWQWLKPKDLEAECIGATKAVPFQNTWERNSPGHAVWLRTKLSRTLLKSALAAPALLLCLLAAAALSTVAAQEPTIRVDVRLVSVFVNVTDRNGAIVGGLGSDDFFLTEDGRPQKIAVFERQSELPLNITLAIDTSGSVRKDMTEETTAARRFVRSILRPQDQMSVLEFATNVRELTPFTSKPAQIDRALGQLRGDFATALYDAIALGADRLGKREGRKVLVLVSDGDDTVQSTSYAQALEKALRNEVTIYSIIDVPIEASAGRDLGGEHALITLAEQTGGKHFYVTEGGLDKAFEQVSADLRTQYLLGYYPHNQEPGRSFHRIEVTVPRAAQSDFNVRHKTGYYGDAAERER